MYRLQYIPRRGTHAGWTITYTYFKSRIRINGKNKNLGTFQTAEQAAEAYQKALRRRHI